MKYSKKDHGGCVDVFRAFLIENSQFAGMYDMPVLRAEHGVPRKLIRFSEACREKKDYNQWVMFYENDFKFESKIIIDVGSGAGFPAIFLAFLLPESEIHLFEPAPKKSAFLAFAKTELALKNVRVHAAKIQNCEKFRADLVTSRALARARDLIALCDGFYDENTTFLLYKGGEAENETAELAADNSNLNYALKNGVGERKYLYLKGLKCC